MCPQKGVIAGQNDKLVMTFGISKYIKQSVFHLR